jgi:hypothetical protein
MNKAKKGISLHVGLNAVNPEHYAGWVGELAACEADAEDMLVIAKSASFARSTLLRTKDATRARVLAELQKASSELEAGDLFFLSYSGHGGQLPDRSGDEDDYMDETWCLYDGELVDDELEVQWHRFRAGVRVLVLSDSCHSGTVTRALPTLGLGGATRSFAGMQGGEEPARYRAMPLQVATRVYQRNKEFYDDLQMKIEVPRGEPEATVRLISGCQDNQLSADGAFNGLFTSTLLRVWNGGRFEGSYADFHRAILTRMPPDQSPKHFVLGRPDPTFDAQRPFAIG